MPAPRTRTRTRWDIRRNARPFVATVLFISLLAGYAALASHTTVLLPAVVRRRSDVVARDHVFVEHSNDGALRARTPTTFASNNLSATITGQECRDVHLATDQCAFILNNCADDEAGLLPYLTLYYCTLGSGAHSQAFAFALLAAWLGLLFTTIGIAASDFFSVNLSTIAGVLGLSESLAGVTFLAFGNGSPDVFSTFAAMGSNSGSMAVGELIGAASFITAVVAGSMALVREFRVSRRTFVRDVCFFVAAVSFAMVFLADGQLRLWECCVMIGFYVFYVIVVVGWHWFSTRRRKRRMKDVAARSHFYGATGEERDELAPYRDEPDEEDTEAAPVGRRSEDATDITALERGPRIEVDDVDGLAPSPDEEDERGRQITAEVTSSMRLNRPRWSRSNTTTITPIRPSLVGALEFRSILASLSKERNMRLRPLWDRMQTDHPAHSAPGSHRSAHGHHNRATSLALRRGTVLQEELTMASTEGEDMRGRGEESPRMARERALSSGDFPRNLENDNLASPTRSRIPKQPSPVIVSDDGMLAPPANPFLGPPAELAAEQFGETVSAAKPGRRLQLQIPSQNGPSSGGSSPAVSPFPALSESPLPLSTPPPQSEQRNAYFPNIPERRQSSLPSFDEPLQSPKPVRWWPYKFLPPPHILFGTLFPTLQGWKEKTILDKVISLVSVPSIFILVVTLPVVETETPEEDSDISSMEPVPATRGPSIPTPAPVSVEEVAAVEPETEWQEYRRRRSTINSRGSPLLGSPTLQAVNAEVATQAPRDEVTRTQAQAQNSRDTLSAPQPPQTPPPRAAAKPSPSFALDRTTDGASDATSAVSSTGWNRWLVAVQIFTGPFFVVFIVWANMADDLERPGHDLLLWTLCSLVFSLAALGVLLLTTTPDRRPRYHFLLCFLGFVISVAWISTVAGEVVGVLKAFGVILGISEAILGLTIFAVGNSLGDLVADVTVARLGYPVMALAACFGGPMLNILLGVGIGGAWMTISSAKAKHRKHPDRPIEYKPYHIQVGGTLMISAVTVLVTLLILLIVVPANRWVMSRRIGWGLIAIWTVSTVVNLVIELTGVWEDIS